MQTIQDFMLKEATLENNDKTNNKENINRRKNELNGTAAKNRRPPLCWVANGRIRLASNFIDFV